MKKLFLSAVLIAAVATNHVNAQGLLGKIKNATKEADAGTNVTTTDEFGLSGNYDMSTVWEYYGDKIKKMSVKFVKEENGTIVNRFILVFRKNDEIEFKFNEKMFNKTGVKLFSGYLVNKPFDIMQLDNGVLFLNCTQEKGYMVLAKDKELLKTWDEETGLAKYEAEKKKVNAVASAGLRKKLEDFKAYKENVGKVIFTAGQGVFANMKDDASEDPSYFITEWVTGNGLAWKAYFDKAYNETCPECGKNFNIVFEMGKYKVDVMQIRSSSSAYSKLYAPEISYGSQYMAHRWLWDGYDFNRALTLVLHQNIKDGSLKDGQKMNLKMSIYSYKDKTNGEKIAEGSIAVKYAADASNWIDRYKAFKDSIE
jgi:hypothetical protein